MTIHIHQCFYLLLDGCGLHVNNNYMHRYASKKISKLEAEGKLRRRSRFNKWSTLTLPELHGFLAIIFNMGIIDYLSWRIIGRPLG